MSRCKTVLAMVVLLTVVGLALAATGVAYAGMAAHASFASDCKAIRAKHPGLPSSLSVAISPYNAELERTNPKNPSQMQGVEPDLLALVAKCLNFKYSYSAMSFSSVIAAVQGGRTELGLTAIFVTPARAKVFQIVSHMKSVDQVVLNKDAAAKVHSLNDLCGLTIAETVGTAEVAYVDKLSKKCTQRGKAPIKTQQYQDIASLFLNTALKRTDATINSDTLTTDALKKFKGKLVAGPYVKNLTFVIGLGVSKRVKGLGQAVTAAVKEIQKLGMDRKILVKWGFPASAQVPAKLYGK